MKKTFFTFLSCVVIISLFYFISCNKKDSVASDNLSYDVNQVFTLNQKGLLDDNIYLPAGTQWQYVNTKGTEVKFVLPKGYTFLLKDNSNNTFKIDPTGGGYSCTCSGKNGSCTVFYNKDAGYGCLQSNCTGSCTGTPTATATLKILGVLIANDSIPDFTNTYEDASLSDEGKQAFFKVPQIQETLQAYYNLLYKNIPVPNFDAIKPDNIPSNYAFIKGQYYGFHLALLINNDVKTNILRNINDELSDKPLLGIILTNENVKKTIQNFTNAVTNVENGNNISCSCSGGSRGSNCSVQSVGMLGYKAYYCTGCTTCTMSQ